MSARAPDRACQTLAKCVLPLAGGPIRSCTLSCHIGPGVDEAHGGEVAIADEEIFRAMGGAMRQIENELIKRHEALTRERSPVLIGARWLLRAGSGAGSGS